MSTRLNVVVVSGSTQQPSKTDALLNAVADELAGRVALDTNFVRLSELQSELGSTVRRSPALRKLEAAIDAIESADVLLVGTPVYRGSYSGLFKHLFDLVHQDALHGKPVLLVATGGSERHALVLEHHLRPLFSFFQALTLPLGVYGTDADFNQYRVTSAALTARIELAVQFALPWLGGQAGGQHVYARPALKLSA